jgi:shikimate dehydrogenase
MKRLKSGELQGLNVTIPHKRSVMTYLDELSPAARAIGAANTLLCQDGRMLGENTDAPGFLVDLERAVRATSLNTLVEWGRPRYSALVLGAGGAARAVVYALAQAGWCISVAARRLEQSRSLVEGILASIPGAHIISIPIKDLKDNTQNLKLIVNATPVGMLPDVDASPWPQETPFPQGALVYDLVYKPVETMLVRTARQAGLPAYSGLGMLVEQAALALERWTGRSVPRKAMFAAIE